MGILKVILLAGSFQGIILFVLLLSRKSNKAANWFLAAFILIVSLHMVLITEDSMEFFMRYPHLSRIGWLFPTTFAPLIYLYTRQLVRSFSKVNFRHLWVFLPSIAYLALLTPYFIQSAEIKKAYIANYEIFLGDDFGWMNQLTNVFHLFFLILTLWEVRNYQRKIVQFYSEVEAIQLRWLQQLVTVLLVLVVFSILIFYMKKWETGLLADIYPYHYLGVVIIFYWMGYMALSQPQIFEIASDVDNQDSLGNPKKIKYSNSSLNEQLTRQYLKNLLDYMEREKPYLESEVTLDELAQHTGISKHHISQLINERLQKNFYDFINSYRVKETQKSLLDPKKKHLSTLGIALDAGFNSKSTFNAVFKKMTGKIPSEYVKFCREGV